MRHKITGPMAAIKLFLQYAFPAGATRACGTRQTEDYGFVCHAAYSPRLHCGCTYVA